MQLPGVTRARLGAAAAAAIPTLAFAGCTADQSDLQNKIKTYLNNKLSAQNVSVTNVSCPSNVQLKADFHFTCTVTGTENGQAQTFTFSGHIDKDNNIIADNLTRQGGGGSSSTPPQTTT
jgi:hypothetical protein